MKIGQIFMGLLVLIVSVTTVIVVLNRDAGSQIIHHEYHAARLDRLADAVAWAQKCGGYVEIDSDDGEVVVADCDM